MRLRNLLALLLIFGLFAAACGSDSDGDTSTAGEDSATDDDEMSEDEMSEDEMSEDEMSEHEGTSTEITCPAESLKNQGQLTVATGEPVFEPWMVDDDPSNGQGFESALVYAIAEELGIGKVEWQRTTFDDPIAPGEKPYDFNIQQYSINDDRDKVVDFSDGYYTVEQALVGASDSSIASAGSVGDLVDARLGAAIGTTSLDYVDEVIQPSSDASVFDDNAAAKAAFEADQVDGIVFDLPTAYYITAVEIPEASIIGVLPAATDAEELGMLFEEGSSMVDCVNQALAAIRDSGLLADLQEEWLNQGGSIPTLTQ